jgi:DNA-binding GntR family transcriptional regulator
MESARALKDFVDRTRRAISAGRLLPGTVLELDQLADELDVPPALLDQAVRRLETAGLVRFDRSMQAVVAPMDPRELDRVFMVRRALQPEVFATATLASPLDGYVAVDIATKDFTVLDWRSDEVYVPVWQAFKDFLAPVVSAVELEFIIELEQMCERSQRIGYDELDKHHRTDLDTLRVSYQETIDAARMRSPAAARETELRFLEVAEQVSRLSLRVTAPDAVSPTTVTQALYGTDHTPAGAD